MIFLLLIKRQLILLINTTKCLHLLFDITIKYKQMTKNTKIKRLHKLLHNTKVYKN